MDDEKEYEELMKAEAQEQRSTALVTKAFRAILVLLIIDILIASVQQIAHFINVP